MKEASYNLIDDGEYTPPNFRTSKVHGGFLVWIVDETTGNALSVAFVPDAAVFPKFSSAEPAELPESDFGTLSGLEQVTVYNPWYDGKPEPLYVWVMNN